MKKEEYEIPKNISKIIPPDGGWGWVVAIGSITNAVLINIMTHAFSIIYGPLFLEKHTTTTTIAWIFNLAQVVTNVFHIILPALKEEFGWRKVAFSSGLTIGLSTILSAFATNSQFLFLTYSFLFGSGAGLGILLSILIIAEYFEKRRGIVNGFVSAGLCSAQFFAPSLVILLQDSFGFKGAIAIIGAILLNGCVCAAVFQPVKWHAKICIENRLFENIENGSHSKLSHKPIFQNERVFESNRSSKMYDSIECVSAIMSEGNVVSVPDNNLESERKEKLCSSYGKCHAIGEKLSKLFTSTINNISLLKHARVIILSVTYSLTLFCYLNFVMLFPLVMASRGFERELTSKGLIVFGISNVLTRLIISPMTDLIKLSTKWYYAIGNISAIASLIGLTYSNEEVLICVSMSGLGIGFGACVCLFPLLTVEVMGLKLLPSTYSAGSLINMLFMFIGGPIIGFIRDATQDYNLCLIGLAILKIFDLLLWCCLPFAVKRDNKRFMEEKEEKS